MVRLSHLYRKRMEHGWTLEQLAAASGLTRQTLSLIERGKTEPKPSSLVKISEALGCSIPELMEPEQP